MSRFYFKYCVTESVYLRHIHGIQSNISNIKGEDADRIDS